MSDPRQLFDFGWMGLPVHPHASAGGGGPGHFRFSSVLGQSDSLDASRMGPQAQSQNRQQCTANDPPPPPPPSEPDLGFLFMQCINPRQGLSEADYKQAATQLGVDVATIMAVAEVETAGAAFDEAGRPRILYERHYFHKATGGKYAAKHPTISNKSAGGYGKFSVQYAKLEEAYGLDVDAALGAASWGRFQIMGANFRASGFQSVRRFVKAMTESESAHLMAFVGFVNSNKAMKTALQKRDWATFAAAYNGPGYAKNNYDTKLADAYKKHAPPPPAAAPAKKPLP